MRDQKVLKKFKNCKPNVLVNAVASRLLSLSTRQTKYGSLCLDVKIDSYINIEIYHIDSMNIEEATQTLRQHPASIACLHNWNHQCLTEVSDKRHGLTRIFFSLCTRSFGIALHSQSQVLIFLFVNHSKFTVTFPRKWLTKPTTSLSTTFHFEPFGAIQFDHTRFSGGGTKHMGLQGAAFVHAAIPPFEHPI